MVRVQALVQLLDMGNRQVLRVLLEKLLAVDALRRPQQGNGAVTQEGQQPFADALVKLRQFQLAGAAGEIDDALGMGDLHTGEGDRRGGLFAARAWAWRSPRRHR